MSVSLEIVVRLLFCFDFAYLSRLPFLYIMKAKKDGAVYERKENPPVSG